MALFALVGGFAVGAVAERVSPAAAQALLSVADPVGALWVNAIRMTVVPLVVSLVITGIVQSRDSRSVGRLSTRSIVTFVVLLLVIATAVALVAPPMFALLQIDPAAAETLRASVAGAAESPPLPSIASWITGTVPVNPVKAAVDGAMLPLLVFAVLFALALRKINPQGREACGSFFAAVAEAMMVIVRWILAVTPIGVAALALSLGVRLGTGTVGAVAFYLIVHVLLALLAALALYPVVRVVAGVPMGRFARAALPAQLVAASTRSSLAATPAMLDAARRDLGMSDEASGFVIPFAVSVFRLNLAVSWTVGALFIAKLYGVPFGAAAVASVALASVALSFSVPGIPSGSLFIVAPVFVSLGLPVEGVGILIALDTIPDIAKTTLNVTGHLTAAAIANRGTLRETQPVLL